VGQWLAKRLPKEQEPGGSAKEINQSTRSQNGEKDHSWYKPPPNESVDHTFGFYVESALWASARGAFKQVPTVTTW